MTSFTQPSPFAGISGWLSRTEAWMDDKGKGAWIVAMVLSFIFAWPLGLALLAYMIWSKKMTCTSRRRFHRSSRMTRGTSGNAAFDAYKSETLQRLQDEQEKFAAFLQRLRDARDKAEFDQFMDDRAKSATPDEGNTTTV